MNPVVLPSLTSLRPNPDWAKLPLFSRKGWQRLPFGAFADSINDRVEPADAADEPYVGLEDLDPGSLHVRRWGKGSDVIGTKLRFRKGDIIFGRRRAYQRKLAVAEMDGICSAHAMVVRTKPGVILPEFLPFLMMSDRFMNRAVEISVGSLSPTINWTTLKLEVFDVPPLDQQRRIAQILWAADETQIQEERIAEALVNYERTYLAELLGGLVSNKRCARLGDLSLFITSGSRGWAEYYSDTGPIFLRSQNIRDQRLEFTDLQRVQPPKGAEGQRTRTAPGDIVITITGNSVGNVAYIPRELDEAYVSQHVGLVRLRDPAMHRMLAAFFGRNGPGNEQILRAQYGLKPGLNLTALNNFIVPVTTDAQLAEITANLDSFDRTKAAVDTNVLSIAQLKQTVANQIAYVP